MRLTAQERLIIALDGTRLSSLTKMARQLKGTAGTLKIGSIAFTLHGPALIRKIKKLGFDIMLDLKFFDIPNTVQWSCWAAAQQGVSLVTVHSSGGVDMIAAAAKGLRSGARAKGVRRPLLLGVTVLTSVATRSGAVKKQVLRLAQSAKRAGCDGIVASAQEARSLRRRLGSQVLLVCPGIRPTASKRADQKRVASPSQALEWGADKLVVGRPITDAKSPRLAAEAIIKEMEGKWVQS